MVIQDNRLTALLKLLLIQQRHQRSKGFTLLDVLAAILVLSTFIGISMNAMATSVLLKTRARVTTEANNWIEQDLELVKNQAAQLTYAVAANTAAAQTQVTLVNNYGLTAGEQISIAGSSTIYTIQSVSGNTLNLSSGLAAPASANSAVSPISECKATTSTAGLANTLQQSLPAVTNSGTRTFSNRSFTLSRQVSVSNTAPFQVLQLTYTVTPQGSTTPIATMYTEVVPYAAFQCPSA